MNMVIIGFVAGGVVFAPLGYWLATHIHAVAAQAVSAVTRATTVPQGDVDKLNAAVSGLGEAAQKLAQAAQAPAVNAVQAASNAAQPLQS